jgi:hypothetical protein
MSDLYTITVGNMRDYNAFVSQIREKADKVLFRRESHLGRFGAFCGDIGAELGHDTYSSIKDVVTGRD